MTKDQDAAQASTDRVQRIQARLDQRMTEAIRAFMASDDLEGCRVPIEARREAMDTRDYQEKCELTMNRAPRQYLTYISLNECLKVAGITLQDLLAKPSIGLTLDITDPEQRHVRDILAQFPEGDKFLPLFNRTMSWLLPDFWFYNDMVAAGPTKRFHSLRLRYAASEQAKIDERCEQVSKSYRSTCLDTTRATAIDPEELSQVVTVSGFPARWVFGLGEGACAFLPNEDADIALMIYTMMFHEDGMLKRTYMEILNRRAALYGIR